MVGQWLGLCASTAVGTSSIPSQGTWIPQVAKKPEKHALDCSRGKEEEDGKNRFKF